MVDVTAAHKAYLDACRETVRWSAEFRQADAAYQNAVATEKVLLQRLNEALWKMVGMQPPRTP